METVSPNPISQFLQKVVLAPRNSSANRSFVLCIVSTRTDDQPDHTVTALDIQDGRYYFRSPQPTKRCHSCYGTSCTYWPCHPHLRPHILTSLWNYESWTNLGTFDCTTVLRPTKLWHQISTRVQRSHDRWEERRPRPGSLPADCRRRQI